jgi:DNA-binding transcriptional LysR family regulator
MDLQAVRAFIRVAELASFTRAAETLGLPKSRVSESVSALEAEVGSRLLQRTTRSVRPTPDGELFLARALRLVTDADDLSAMFQAQSTLRGIVRVDLPVGLGCKVIIPRLPELLATHPNLDVRLSTTDRRVELMREGFDCVLRIGELAPSSLVARRLGVLRMMNYASPAYLRRHGTPRALADLDHHVVVHYSLSLGDAPGFEHRDGDGYRERPMRSLVTVNSADAYEAACIAGLGIIQAPRWGHEDTIARGLLVEVLPDFPCAPMPVSLLHGHGRNVPKRVRAIMAWLTQTLEPVLREDDARPAKASGVAAKAR